MPPRWVLSEQGTAFAKRLIPAQFGGQKWMNMQRLLTSIAPWGLVRRGMNRAMKVEMEARCCCEVASVHALRMLPSTHSTTCT